MSCSCPRALVSSSTQLDSIRSPRGVLSNLALMAEDSVRLAERAAAGDRAALDELVVRHVDGLRAFVRLRVGPELRARESSSDLVQSVCREVLQDARRFQHAGESAFKSWLYTTA